MALEMSWVLPPDKLGHRPSLKDDVSLEEERTLRMYGCELIQEAAILLKIPQVAACTGQALLHRFYFKKSLAKHDVRDMAAACLFTAAKYEECIKCNGRDIRHFINVLHDMYQRRDGEKRTALPQGSRRQGEMKNKIVKSERYLLRELGFVLNVTHPHNFLPNFIKVVDKQGKHSELLQCAWSLCNDSLRTELCVRMKPEHIACGAIHLASYHLNVALPEDPPWWELFGCDRKSVETFVELMVDLYNQKKPTYRKVRAGIQKTKASPAVSNGTGVEASPAPVPSPSPVRPASPHPSPQPPKLNGASQASQASESEPVTLSQKSNHSTTTSISPSPGDTKTAANKLTTAIPASTTIPATSTVTSPTSVPPKTSVSSSSSSSSAGALARSRNENSNRGYGRSPGDRDWERRRGDRDRDRERHRRDDRRGYRRSRSRSPPRRSRSPRRDKRRRDDRDRDRRDRDRHYNRRDRDRDRRGGGGGGPNKRSRSSPDGDHVANKSQVAVS